ncbi:dermonecrotic toxin SPH-like isoform X2 [Haemaphysalis longicornis]
MTLRASSALCATMASVAFIVFTCVARGDDRRPVYNIAHMVNSVVKLDKAMKQGANAVEADVTFADNGTALKLFHGVPCDCFRACEVQDQVPTFLRYVRRTTGRGGAKRQTPSRWLGTFPLGTTTVLWFSRARATSPLSQRQQYNRKLWNTFRALKDGGKYRQQLALLVLDLKSGNIDSKQKYRAGVDIAEKLIENLWYGVPPWDAMDVLLSVPSVSDKEILRGVIQTITRFHPVMLDKIGFDISNNDKLERIRAVYRELNIGTHRWQGDGVSNCLSFLRPPARLQSVIDDRDSEKRESFVDKAYQWTVDLPKQLRRSLRRGVDGIITNRPTRLKNILQEEEFQSKLREATAADSPWRRFGGGSLFPRMSVTDMDFLGDDDWARL